MMVLLLSSRGTICPDIVLCYGYTAAGTWKSNFWLFGYHFAIDNAGQIWLHNLVPFASVPFYCKYSLTIHTWIGQLCLCVEFLMRKREQIYSSFTANSLQRMAFGCIRAGFYQGTLTCFPECPIPLLHFNSSPSDFVASKLVQKVLQQCYQFLFLQDFVKLY